jgi:murein DD-endopeptidase MepM/ murein hydrolase activator NlpD
VHPTNAILRLLAPVLLFATPAIAGAYDLVWPTPNPAFSQGAPIEDFIQPPASGDPVAGTFGAVRTNGRRFHEGIDIKPVMPRTRKGEPTDPVYAAMDGTVAHISTMSGKSNYGRYVVILHNLDGVEVYTLYAHLASIRDGIRPGAVVTAGTEIATLGRSSSGYVIPKDRAHVHFEIGLRYGTSFQSWYDRQKFGSPNWQGSFNGMNLEGFDPLQFFHDYSAGKAGNMAEYIRALPSAYILRVNAAQVPQIVQWNPGLLARPVPEGGPAAWDITFTWYGMPKQFNPVSTTELGTADRPGVVRLMAINRAILEENHCRDTVRMKNGKPVLYTGAIDIVEMIFGRDFPAKGR